ncbi:MAG: FAD:protein FMN transferase [Actinomycetota bacterium]
MDGHARFRALGTMAVVAAPERSLESAVAEVDDEISAIDVACSRFRSDSDLARVNAAGGAWTRVSALLLEAVDAAVRAAEITGGLVDPLLGGVMLRLGYDRDFGDLPFDGEAVTPATWIWKRSWRDIEFHRDRSEIRIPRDVGLDLGSTAKALAADRAALRASSVVGAPVLVSIGGDVAVAGEAPDDGWAIGIADDSEAAPELGESIAIAGGGVATSSTTVRRWSKGGEPVHHIVDPRTGLPAREVWRTASVYAGSCVDANTASTAAVVLGEQAPEWLSEQALPSRLVRSSGTVKRVAGWPGRRAA